MAKKKLEKFYQSRRVWAAALTFVAVVGNVCFPEHNNLLVAVTGCVASFLGLASWKFPKK